MQNKEQYFKVTSTLYTELNNPKAILIMAYLTSYNKKNIEVEQAHLARILGYKGNKPQRYIKPVIQYLIKEGWLEGYEKVQAKNGYKSVTTRWHLTDKALSLSAAQQPIQKEREQQQEKKENTPTTHKEREQEDASSNPQRSNEIKKNTTKQPKPTNTKFLDIVAARREYENKLKEKFFTQNGKLS